MKKYICSCPLCSSRVGIKSDTPIGYIYKCKKCNAQLRVTPTGNNTLDLSLYFQPYRESNQCRKCITCDWADKSKKKYITDILNVECALYKCKRDIKGSSRSASSSTFRAYCNKEDDLKMDDNIPQTCGVEEMKNYGLSIVCRNIKQKNIILNLCRGYAKQARISLEIDYDVVTQLPAYYNNHTATVRIKLKSNKIVITVFAEIYDPMYCISYYSACSNWVSLSSDFNSILNSLNNKDKAQL